MNNPFQQMVEALIDFRDRRGWGKHHTPENLAKSICIEAAELLECYQWGDGLDPTNVEDELADVMIYLLLFGHELGVDWHEIVQKKIEKNGKKYREV